MSDNICYEIIPYNQCNEVPGVQLLEGQELLSFEKKLSRLSALIQDESKLINEYESYIKKNSEHLYMPENLQYSIRGENSIDAINSLQEAIDTLERAVNILEEIEVLDDENEEDKIEKESRQNELNDYIDQAISSLEDIY